MALDIPVTLVILAYIIHFIVTWTFLRQRSCIVAYW